MIKHTQSQPPKLEKNWVLNSSDTPIRSLVKAYSYRCCGTLTTIIISYVITGKIIISLGIGATEMVIKPLIYWCHERVWNKVKWGKA